MSTQLLTLALVALLGHLYCAEAVSSPKVQVYARHHVETGKENVLQCFVSGFHPPNIQIHLLKNGKSMPDAEQKDMVFGTDWTFQVLKYATFTPNSGDKYECEVAHNGEMKKYAWDPMM